MENTDQLVNLLFCTELGGLILGSNGNWLET